MNDAPLNLPAPGSASMQALLEDLPLWRDRVRECREILLTNLVMLGEIPAPTFHEADRIAFVRQRFNESLLSDNTIDEAGNAIARVPGKTGGRTLAVVAHADTLNPLSKDHTVEITADHAVGFGLADNSLGLAVLVSLPMLLDQLGLQFDADLMLVGDVRSLGRGNLEGINFVLSNYPDPIAAGICLEGFELGRLNIRSVGMLRAEIQVRLPEQFDWSQFGASGAVAVLNDIINLLQAIPLPRRPESTIVLGQIESGAGFARPALHGRLRFEIRSESSEVVAATHARVQAILDEVASLRGVEVNLDVVATREPGGIAFEHPLPATARAIHEALEIETRLTPSLSELAAFIQHDIPAVTLGLTTGSDEEAVPSEIDLDPLYTGVAQVLGMLAVLDAGTEGGDA